MGTAGEVQTLNIASLLMERAGDRQEEMWAGLWATNFWTSPENTQPGRKMVS